jgi:hypothetical protein
MTRSFEQARLGIVLLFALFALAACAGSGPHGGQSDPAQAGQAAAPGAEPAAPRARAASFGETPGGGSVVEPPVGTLIPEADLQHWLGLTAQSGRPGAAFHVAVNAESWRTTWGLLKGREARPEVDFEKNRVLVVLHRAGSATPAIWAVRDSVGAAFIVDNADVVFGPAIGEAASWYLLPQGPTRLSVPRRQE